MTENLLSLRIRDYIEQGLPHAEGAFRFNLSSTNYSRLKFVVHVAYFSGHNQGIKDLALRLLSDVESGDATIYKAYESIMAAVGRRGPRPSTTKRPFTMIVKTPNNEVVNKALNGLEGLTYGLELVHDRPDVKVTKENIEQLKNCRRRIESIINKWRTNVK